MDRCLAGWTPGMLDVGVESAGGVRLHSRQSILLRLLSHDAYHAGELPQTLGVARLPQIDLWPSEDHAVHESEISHRRRPASTAFAARGRQGPNWTDEFPGPGVGVHVKTEDTPMYSKGAPPDEPVTAKQALGELIGAFIA